MEEELEQCLRRAGERIIFGMYLVLQAAFSLGRGLALFAPKEPRLERAIAVVTRSEQLF